MPSACQTDITGKDSELSISAFASTWSPGLLHPERCNLELSSATCCMGFFLSGGLTEKMPFISLRSAQRPARAVHGEVQVLKARIPGSIPSLQGPCLTTSTEGSPEATISQKRSQAPIPEFRNNNFTQKSKMRKPALRQDAMLIRRYVMWNTFPACWMTEAW